METPCGLDDKFFKLFAECLSKNPELYSRGLLSVDEIKTRQNLPVDPKSIKILGLADYGNEEQVKVSEKADHGMIFMFQPLMGSFTQPVAVFVSKGPACGTTIAKLIVQVISQLEKAGAKMHGVITDGALTNRKIWSEMRIIGKMNNVQRRFSHPTEENRKLYVFSDTPYLIKCIHNRLYERGEL